ncbi:G-protein coupled receptor moody-like isoform X1 [Scylla paramamosain]
MMENFLSTDDGLSHLTHLTTLLTETSTSSFTSVLPDSSYTDPDPEANFSISDMSIDQKVNGTQKYPADMLGFTAACAFIIAILGTFGNLLTIIALPMAKNLRTTATAFVVNLAVVELLFCVLILPMSGAQYLYLQRHLQGSLLTDTHCIFFVCVRYTLTQVELQTILAIALTRALAVSVPRFYQAMNRPTVIGVYIGAIWVYSFSTRMPAAVGVMGQYMYNANTMECDLGNANKVARLVYLVVDAFIPVMLIFILYFFVFIMVVRRAVVRQRKFSTNFPPPPSQIKMSSNRVARASKRSRAAVAPPTASTTSTSSTTVPQQRKGSSSSLKNLKKMVSETNLRARFTRQSSNMSQRLTSTRRDMRVARTIFIIFLLVLVCSVPVAVVHAIDPAVGRPVRFLLVHILYWFQYCLNMVVYVLMNRQYRDAYVDCLARVFPRFKRHRGLRFFWEKASISSRPQPNPTSKANPADSSASEVDQTVTGIPVAASRPPLTAIPEGHSSSAANDSVFSEPQQKTPEEPFINEYKEEENNYEDDSDREDEKEKEDVDEEKGEDEEEKHSLMNTEHWVTRNGDTVSDPDFESKV